MPETRRSVTVRRPRLMRQGLHVMPFLSREGQLVLVALDYGSTFAYMASVTAAEGSDCQQFPMSVGGGRVRLDVGRAFVGNGDAPPSATQYAPLWAAGIYRAPWQHPLHESDWLAIDERGRLAARATVLREDASATRQARAMRSRQAIADLRSLLDALDSDE